MKKVLVLVLCILYLFTNIVVVEASEGETPAGVPFVELESFIDNYMAQYIGKSAPGAAVAVVKDGKIIFSKGYGYADLENGISVDQQTVFEYGSISKLFVYTTIMRLVEDGKLDLQTDIQEYLPAGFLKKLTYAEPITMLNIMNHTTGFEDYLFDIILTSTIHLQSLEEVLLSAQPRQVYRPGTVSAYSNYAVALAAYIAEQMLGQEFYQYLEQSIFVPLGMQDTSAQITLADKPQR